MRIKEIKVYKFDELSDKARQHAMENYREIYSEVMGSEDCWNIVDSDAKGIGIEIICIDDHKGKFTEGAMYTANKIVALYKEDCETHRAAQTFLFRFDELEKDEHGGPGAAAYDDLRNAFLKDLLKDYRYRLNQEYEYQNSDKMITENILANGAEFDEDGKMV